jgi:predicted O-methyltransferase YrrM
MSDRNKPKAIEVGELTTIDFDDTEHTYAYAMLIEFDSLEAVREALNNKRVEFTFLE